MDDLLRKRLIAAALEARQRAYAPYSKFLVGAALLTSEGEIVTGCNVENASYGLTICAERVAVGTAVSAGRRQFVAVAVATSGGGSPCGACRQVLAEFNGALPVLLVNADVPEQVVETSIRELLPAQFSSASLAP